MKILIAPGTFKGSLTAVEAGEAMAAGVKAAMPDVNVVLVPVGDGGEGTSAALHRVVPGGDVVRTEVMGPTGRPVSASFVLLGPNRRTAALDMASAAGLLLAPEQDRNPMRATTFGVGELIRQALSHNAVTQIVIGLGGSATSDCGAGCLQALGYRLLDSDGGVLNSPLLPPDLSRVARIDDSKSERRLQHLDVVLACDVDNPLCGVRGASRVFGPQMGATPDMVDRLDDLLRHFGGVLDRFARERGQATGGPAIGDRPGAGAAGGLGAALMSVFPRATVTPGIDVVLDAAEFGRLLEGADLVLTGEGRLDMQTLGGKAIDGVLRRASAVGVPTVAIVGSAEPEAVDRLRGRGLVRSIQLVDMAGSIEAAIRDAAKLVSRAAESAVGAIHAGSG